MKPIIKWEFRQRRTALLWWCIGAFAIVAIIMLIYPPLKDQAAQYNKVLNQLPNGLKQLKSGGSSSVNIGNPVDFLNSQLYYISLPIVLIILTITRGSSLIGRDEQDKTLELLLARPLSRGRVLAGKALSGILETLVVTAVATLAAMGLAKAVGLDVGTLRLVSMGLYTWLFCLSFGAIAFALTAAGRFTKRASTGIAVLISFGGYLLAGLSGMNRTVANIAKFLPYHYFLPGTILSGKAVTGLDIYLLGIFVVCALLAYRGFRQRDIN